MTNTVFCFTPGSRRVDENIDSYSPQEVRLKNNMFNVTVPRKRVPKVNPEISSFFFFFTILQYIYSISQYLQYSSVSIFRTQKRFQTVQTRFTRGGGSLVIMKKYVSKKFQNFSNVFLC